MLHGHTAYSNTEWTEQHQGIVNMQSTPTVVLSVEGNLPQKKGVIFSNNDKQFVYLATTHSGIAKLCTTTINGNCAASSISCNGVDFNNAVETISSDGTLAAISSNSNHIQIYTINSLGKLVSTKYRLSKVVTCPIEVPKQSELMRFAPNKRFIFIGDVDGSAYIWYLNTNKLITLHTASN